jgi:hypothetical protein
MDGWMDGWMDDWREEIELGKDGWREGEME